MLLIGLRDPGDEGTMIPGNVGHHSPAYSATTQKNAFLNNTTVSNPNLHSMAGMVVMYIKQS
jgi:hypothetical protein